MHYLSAWSTELLDQAVEVGVLAMFYLMRRS